MGCKKPKIHRSVSVNRDLSFRENQVIQLLVQSKTNKEIASDLDLAEGTVKMYLHSIFNKLGVRNRTELAIRASSSRR
jgi:DNA-binding NarL/FixJ family response regulator